MILPPVPTLFFRPSVFGWKPLPIGFGARDRADAVTIGAGAVRSALSADRGIDADDGIVFRRHHGRTAPTKRTKGDRELAALAAAPSGTMAHDTGS